MNYKSDPSLVLPNLQLKDQVGCSLTINNSVSLVMLQFKLGQMPSPLHVSYRYTGPHISFHLKPSLEGCFFELFIAIISQVFHFEIHGRFLYTPSTHLILLTKL